MDSSDNTKIEGRDSNKMNGPPAASKREQSNKIITKGIRTT